MTATAMRTVGIRDRVNDHPIAALIARRVALGVITLLAVSILVFAATQVLPGNAAYAALGQTATPARLHALTVQLHLNESAPNQYWTWLSGLLSGHWGRSFADGQTVGSVVGPRLANSAALVVCAGTIGALVGVFLGAFAAFHRDGWFDHVLAVTSLTVTALPEFLIAVSLVFVFATVVFHWLPAVSIVSPGTSAWGQPTLLVLPVATLVIAIVPYVSRMMRAATIEALESDYVEMARLKGVPPWRILLRHAMPNALPAVIQVIGLNLLYLAGGIVVIEYIFAFPGVGQALVNAVSNRDIPVIQFIVVALAAFYVLVNMITDVATLIVTPRRRYKRSG
jgi:peptide/nickel transport system permease protein